MCSSAPYKRLTLQGCYEIKPFGDTTSKTQCVSKALLARPEPKVCPSHQRLPSQQHVPSPKYNMSKNLRLKVSLVQDFLTIQPAPKPTQRFKSMVGPGLSLQCLWVVIATSNSTFPNVSQPLCPVFPHEVSILQTPEVQP